MDTQWVVRSGAPAPPEQSVLGGYSKGASTAPFDPLVAVRDRQLVRREQRDDVGPLRGHDHLFLDPRGRGAVGGRAIRLDGEDHAGHELHRLLERVEPRDDRPLVEPEPKAAISLSNPMSCAFGKHRAMRSVLTPGLISSIALSIHSRARL